MCLDHADAGMIHSKLDSGHSRQGASVKHSKAAKPKKAKAKKAKKHGKRSKGGSAGNDVTETDAGTGFTGSNGAFDTPESDVDAEVATESGLLDSDDADDATDDTPDIDIDPHTGLSISEVIGGLSNNDFNGHFSPALLLDTESVPSFNDAALIPPGFASSGVPGPSENVVPSVVDYDGLATGEVPGTQPGELPFLLIDGPGELAEVPPIEFLNSDVLSPPVVSPLFEVTGLELTDGRTVQHNNPEPASILLAALGGVCVAGTRWHRRRRRSIASV